MCVDVGDAPSFFFNIIDGTGKCVNAKGLAVMKTFFVANNQGTG